MEFNFDNERPIYIQLVELIRIEIVSGKFKKGERINLKSPKELSEEWGINLGSNLIFQGTIFPQPKLYFRIHNVDKVDKQEIIEPTEGRFRPGNPYQSCGRIQAQEHRPKL